MKRITIDLGKGVYVSAPCKDRMTLEEWHRMSSYINGLLSGVTQAGVRVESNKTILIQKRGV